MKLTKLDITNFRNYDKLSLEFEDVNILVGKNGVGKTNILESIYVLAITKSHRSYLDKNLIKEDKDFAKITGSVNKKGKKNTYELVISAKGKKVSINKNILRRISDYLSNFTAILFCPDDLDLIKGSPSERRKFLNIEIGQLNNKYIATLNDYNQLIKNRNEYLKNITFNNYNAEYLSIINNQIATKASIIYDYRYKFLRKVEENLIKMYDEQFKLPIKIEFSNNCEIIDETDNIKEKILNKLNKNLKKEIILGSTQYGPHKDDFDIILDGKNIRDYGSQGQQRLVVLGLKISELSIFKETTGEYPVLLLDDVFSELDIEKRNKIIALVEDDVQVFITSTDVKNINKKIRDNAKIFKIKNCKVQ